jgi:hypothetical protein
VITYNLLLLGGAVSLILGFVLIAWRNVELRLRIISGVVVLVSLVFLIYLWTKSPYGEARRYLAANQRQAYVLGYCLGQYLKQSQSGRQIAILWTVPGVGRSAEAVKGLKNGLDGALKIVAEHRFDISHTDNFQAGPALYTKEFLVELQQSGAEIVVSFLPLSMRFDEAGVFDLQATKIWWKTPEYSAFQWVFPYPPDPNYPWPPGAFRDARVLAYVREKPQDIAAKGFPPHLKIKGTPAEQFNAWFELVTSDEQ